MGGHALAASGLTHKPDGLAGKNRETDIIDRLGHLTADEEMGFKVLDV
jgi:hypothetical protein